MNNSTAARTNFQKILFAVDGSPQSAAATGAVGALAAHSRAEVHVLHVWNSEVGGNRGRLDGVTHRDARQLVDGIAKQLSATGLTVTTELRAARHDRFAEEIAAAAVEYGADVVALGSRGRSDLRALFLGSVSHRVLGLVHCPVLIARGRAQGDGQGKQLSEIKRVLLAVSTGEEIPRAVEAVAAVGQGNRAAVLVLHVRNLAVAEGMAWVEPDADAAAFVAGIVGQLEAAGVTAEGRVAGPSSFVA
ncbi:MAG: universal stress protein, partial [Candidatus Dormibacteraeota bacterium]|nr:universal stress protein [Candidatus Dormibacteraeota bacterium]